jgi:hypothetical protein
VPERNTIAVFLNTLHIADDERMILANRRCAFLNRPQFSEANVIMYSESQVANDSIKFEITNEGDDPSKCVKFLSL